MNLWKTRYSVGQWYARFYTKYLADCVFVHINKTGGSSIEEALGLPFQHRTAVELQDLLGERRWNQRFSFAFVRNPWDRVYSHYRFRVKTNQTGLGDDPIPFPEWVRLAYGDRDPRYYRRARMFQPQLDWITDDSGTVLVDFIGRFERLEDDFREVCRILGRDATLPHLKRSGSPIDYREVYDDVAAEIVAQRFAPDIDHFGYGYDER